MQQYENLNFHLHNYLLHKTNVQQMKAHKLYKLQVPAFVLVRLHIHLYLSIIFLSEINAVADFAARLATVFVYTIHPFKCLE